MSRYAPKRGAKRPDEAPEGLQRKRIWLLLAGYALSFAIIGLRLGYVHLYPSPRLSEEESYHLGFDPLVEPRGEIYDRNLNLLASQRKVPSLWADPKKLAENEAECPPESLARSMAAVLAMEPQEVLSKLTKTSEDGRLLRFVWVKRWLNDVSEEALQELIDASEGGLSVRDEWVRYYPQEDTAAHLLGFVNRAGEASEGLELTFDKHLASVDGEQRGRAVPNQGKVESGASRVLLPSLTLEYTPPKPGEDLILTIDSSIQHSLEEALDARMEEVHASVAMGVLLDPQTGAILAMASRPAFNPNAYSDTPPNLRKNRAILDVFEPGSAFKIVTAAAALEHGLVTPETLIDTNKGRYRVPGHYIRDTHPEDEPIPFSKCFAESSNIAMARIGAEMLGAVRLEQWIRRFGFGECASGGDFQFESAGMFHPRNEWSRMSPYVLPFGQEIGVTVLQMARAMAVIANGGLLIQPYVVERAVDPSGQVTYRHAASPPQRILSPATAATMQHLCEEVVLHGTGTKAAIPEYRAGGKTGTAQMARKDGRGYDFKRYTSVFSGFAPMREPRLVAVIMTQEAKYGTHWGGTVCGPVFRKVMREALVRLHVPEDPLPNAEAVIEVAAVHDPADTVSGGVVVDLDSSMDFLIEGLELASSPADVEPGAPAMPDLTGLTKRQAQEKLAALGLGWDVQGAGWVVRQDPPPGAALRGVSLCALEFSGKAANENDDEERTL